MDDIHNLSSGEFHIFSDVNGHPIDLCRTPPAAREPVIVGNATLRVGVVLCTHFTVELTLGINSSRLKESAARTPTRFGRMVGTFEA